jgi:hypothetical protein
MTVSGHEPGLELQCRTRIKEVHVSIDIAQDILRKVAENDDGRAISMFLRSDQH